MKKKKSPRPPTSSKKPRTLPSASGPMPAAPAAWRRLPTESRHPKSMRLDTLSTERIVTLLLEEDRRGLNAALERREGVVRAADLVARVLAGGGDVVLAGAGTSGRLGVIEAAECPPTFGTDPTRIRAVIAGGDDAVFHAREGAEDRTDDGKCAAGNLRDGDVLIGLSASSVTPFVRGALTEASRRGASTVLITCAESRGLSRAADIVVALDTGPEILTGSTRLKAGSVTKAVLNAITTAAMVSLGKVFENLMVDLRPGSAKLRDRAARIVADAGRVSVRQARALLTRTGGEVKTAVVMARAKVDAVQARNHVAAAHGHLRQALVRPKKTRRP